MKLQRIGIKFFAASPAPVPVREFIPVFHSWIQKQAIENHLLIDIHNYSHIHNGPGILLVAQEGNFSIDSADGRMGLLYYRKKSGDDLGSVLKTALEGCRLLESDPAFAGRLRFRTDEILIVANDRLLAPNNDQSFEELKPSVTAALKLLLPAGRFTLARSSVNPKERLAIHVQSS
jgi:hypothetical protein